MGSTSMLLQANAGNDESFHYFSSDDMLLCFTQVKSRLKHGGNHFYILPNVAITDEDVHQAITDAGQKLLHAATIMPNRFV